MTRWLTRPWGLAVWAMMPILLAYTLHWTLSGPDRLPTGFLQYDQMYYMANARALVNHGVHLLYGLPFSSSDATPAIYFQPHILLLGWVSLMTHADLGLIYDGFGVVMGIIMFRVAIALYRTYGGSLTGLPGAMTCMSFLWGGGVIVLLGLGIQSIKGMADGLDPFILDPFGGFWFLNLGRNAYFACECWYHALFFGAIVALLRRQRLLCFLLTAALSASHPFYGIELILVLGAFALCERLWVGGDLCPIWLIAGFTVLMALHLGYYLVFLNHASAEQAALVRQWTEVGGWSTFGSVPWRVIVAAYGPVMVLAAGQLERTKGWLREPGQSASRLAVIWFAVAFALINHDLIIAPHQPLHFTRGYVWTPLALIALPRIQALFDRLARLRFAASRIALTTCALALILVDNGVWFVRQYSRMARHQDHDAVLVEPVEVAVLARLARDDMKGRLLISDDAMLSYLAVTYDGTRAWRSHYANTPWSDERLAEIQLFVATGDEPPEWHTRPVVIVADARGGWAEGGAAERAGFRRIDQFGGSLMMVRD